ncbi:hypothetical protein DSECCO2_607070 [anaerobic digester metagenome]
MIPGRHIPRIDGDDLSIAAGGVPEPAEMLESQGFAVECVEVARFRIEHPAERLDGIGVVPPVQESSPFLCERIGTVRIRPEDPLEGGRRFPEVTGPFEHPPEYLTEDDILRVSVQRPPVGCCRVGIPAEPFKHLPLPVRGVRVRGFSLDDLRKTSCRLLIVAGSGEGVPKCPQCPCLARSRLKRLSQPDQGFVVPAEAGERLTHGEPDRAVLRIDLERLLETLHCLTVVPGLKLSGSLLYRGVRVLPLTQNITEEIHPTPSAVARYMVVFFPPCISRRHVHVMVAACSLRNSAFATI